MRTEQEIKQTLRELTHNIGDDVNVSTWITIGMIDALHYVLNDYEYENLQDTINFKKACQKVD